MISLKLSSLDRKFLYDKCFKLGLTREEAYHKVNNQIQFLNKLSLDLKQQKKSKEDIHKIFQEEFSNIIEEN